jgi:DNA helicase-2/ATP-dependent DNA helicase PcrA
MNIDYKNQLNPEQYQVVTEADGPCLVLAGAGSGKTRTLVYRVAYLIENGVPPESILLVTFTNKAAKEMLDRVQKLLGFKPEGFMGGTFHHIGNLILRRHAEKLGFLRNFSILDSADSESFVKQAMSELGLNTKGQNFPKASVIHSVISYAKNTNGDLKDIAMTNYSYPDFIADKIVQLGEIYEAKKKKANAMDFDDLLVNWLKLLQQFPEVKRRYTEQFQYILVDEYQDTNYIQAEVIHNLANEKNNVLVVGDDSQSIYSFRAADVKNILNFPNLFPNAKLYKIETNYRSTPQILGLANEIIKNNRNQFSKTLCAKREDSILPTLMPARDEHEQASKICRRIMDLYRDGKDYADIAVLYRSNYQSADIQLELSKRNVPYVVRGGMRYFEQAHVKDVMSYLKILSNFKDELAWKRMLNLYEGFGEKKADVVWKEIQKFASLAEIINGQIVFSGKAGESWNKVLDIFRTLLGLNSAERGFISSAIETILDRGYETYLKNAFENYRDRLDDLSQLLNFVAMYNDLEKLLTDVTLSENFGEENAAKKNVVILSTIHQAKGLEWPVVFIPGLRDGQFPHHKCLDNPKDIEEERRLFYVAATRAKDELNMLYPIRSFSYKFGEVTARPSMFIRELDQSKYSVERSGNYWQDNEDPDEVVIEYD